MAIGLVKKNTIIGIKEEVTEGSFLPPAADTDFVAPLQDGFEISPVKELLERTILSPSIGKLRPRTGIKSVTGALPVEFRASGTEGGATDFDLLLKSALGSSRTVAAQNTSKAAPAHTSSVIQIEDADIADYTVGDFLIILESGAHHPCFIKSKTTGGGSATITIVPAAPAGAFTASVVISKSLTYFPANSGHPTFSASVYHGNENRESAVGCRINTLSLDNFNAGQLASWNFGFEGLSFDEIDGVAPFTPVFDSGLPPVILNACVFQDDTSLDVNNFAFSLTNTLGFITSTCDANGRISSRINDRAITGSFNPYKDDTSVDQFTKFNTDTAYSMVVSAYTPSAVAGEITLGTAVGIYLPNCITTEKKVGDIDLILTEDITFSADRGSAGSLDEIFIGVV